ncbi:glycerol kinase GlpK [bacterium]|nr:glycerol kinase GlpK [bacterium]
MGKSYILSIDQGTTGTTAMILTDSLDVISKVTVNFEQNYPKTGWVEHRPEAIWSSVRASVIGAIGEANISPETIQAIGITNQRETVTLWNKKTGKPYYPFIVWQDRRTDMFCRKLKEESFEEEINKTTGLLLDPYFSGSKIRWILDNSPEAQSDLEKNIVTAGTIDTYLVYRLTGKDVLVTDPSNASRTMLMDLKTLSWSERMAQILGINIDILPEIKSSSEIYGYTKGLDFLPSGIPISGIAGDQQAALFGQVCFQKGEAKCTFGTGSFILMNTGETPVYSDNHLLTTVAWKIDNTTTYALEGSSFIAGALVQWFRDELRMIENSAEIESLAETVDDNGGVVIVPSLTGLGAPYWKADVQGMIYGISRNTNRGHIARAVLEAIALQNYDLFEAMKKDASVDLISLKVDGGASVNSLLMQFQSSVLNVILSRPKIYETTALGAALLAGLGTGIFKNLNEIKKRWRLEQIYSPDRSDYIEESIKRWHLAIRKIMTD